jgi:two-component system, LuxR family, response regulator FixJ
MRQNQVTTLQRILVVDDDPAVRHSLKFALEIEGYAVHAYAGAEELLRESDLPADGCLIIDYNMPGMTGLDALHALRARNIAMPAILITGHPNPTMRAKAAAAKVPLVEKPFIGNVLVEAVRSVIANHPRS